MCVRVCVCMYVHTFMKCICCVAVHWLLSHDQEVFVYVSCASCMCVYVVCNVLHVCSVCVHVCVRARANVGL